MALSKPAGAWSYADLLTLPDDGRRYEVIEGELYEMPSPNFWHATTIMNLVLLLGPVIRALGGRILTAPLDVFFQGADPVQPDILGLLPDWNGHVSRRDQKAHPISSWKCSAHQIGATICLPSARSMPVPACANTGLSISTHAPWRFSRSIGMRSTGSRSPLATIALSLHFSGPWQSALPMSSRASRTEVASMALSKSAGAWTYADLGALPDDGRRYEIIEGDLYEMPPPSWDHAATVMNLIALLVSVVRSMGGHLATAPVGVFLPGAELVEPDILAILPGSRARAGGRGVAGAPDLIIEVLSPSNRGHDLLTKRSLYARAGVREYWIVDPVARSVEVLLLDRDAFHAVENATVAGRVASPLLHATFALRDIFAGLDDVQD